MMREDGEESCSIALYGPTPAVSGRRWDREGKKSTKIFHTSNFLVWPAARRPKNWIHSTAGIRSSAAAEGWFESRSPPALGSCLTPEEPEVPAVLSLVC